jgi:hypothetical protein
VPEPKTLSVPDAGRVYFGLGRNASYAAAARGEIPTIRIGSRLRVPTIAMERMLENVAIPEAAPPGAPIRSPSATAGSAAVDRERGSKS